MEIMMGIAGLSALAVSAFLLARYARRSPLSGIYWPALALKLAAGLALGWVYFYHYEAGDTLAYHHDASIASELAFVNISGYLDFIINPGSGAVDSLIFANQPRALLMSKVISVVYVFAFRNYWLSSLFFSFFSFAGMWFLANCMVVRFNLHKTAVAAALLFFPSIVFWSSGILKESVMMGALGFVVYSYLKLSQKIRLVPGLLCLGSILLIWFLKYYYAAAIAAILLSLSGTILIASPCILQKRKGIATGVFIALLISTISIASFLHPNLAFNRIFDVLIENYRTFIAISRPGSFADLGDLSPNWQSLLGVFPNAVASGIFRPFVWEACYFPAYLSGIENLFIAAISAIALTRLKTVFRSPYYLFIAACLVFVLAMAFFLTVSTPNFGSLARYKIGFMPFYLLIIFQGAIDASVQAIGRLKKLPYFCKLFFR